MDWWFVYLAIGAFVGFMAGLLGIGGGMTMVPMLVFVFTAKSFPADHLMHMALATSMATIPFTSAASVRAHHEHGGVDWSIVTGMLPGLAAGAALGALVAGMVPGRPLAMFFTAFVFYTGINMFRASEPKSGRTLPRRAGLAAVGAVIAFVSSFLAAGAAFITVPYMTWCNVPMRRAIGTAAAIGFPLALASSAGFAYAGSGLSGLPGFSLGYIYLPALGLIVATSVFTAPLGARYTQRVPVGRLRQVFGLMMFGLAGAMLVRIW
ncbi:MAG: sulfite exporter TauE/SafE family protein [Betaproteobacteria bacterium]|nr:sulfite exporter TauE/SafE family protein [Betaproteobacteria bacterium]